MFAPQFQDAGGEAPDPPFVCLRKLITDHIMVLAVPKINRELEPFKNAWTSRVQTLVGRARELLAQTLSCCQVC